MGSVTMNATRELTDGVVTLRPMTAADAEPHLAGEDEAAVRFLACGRSTLATVTAWIERNRLSWATGGPVRCFGIREGATGRLVGMVEANLAAPGFRAGVANISYGLYPAARGRGYATRAVRLMVDHLAAATAATVAVIQVHPENRASLAVPGRAGFRRLGERETPDDKCLLVFGRPLSPDSPLLILADVCAQEGEHP